MISRVTLGRTGITSPKNGFGVLPLQRTPMDEAVRILDAALDGGFTHFDTARAYSDSETKLGQAFSRKRDLLTISTKTGNFSPEGFRSDLDDSLRELKTDHVDIYQFHNPPFVPKPGDGSGLYEEMEKAKAQGKILHVGITNHRLDLAREAVNSGLYECLQFPFSYLASEADVDLVRLAGEKGVGFLAMKSLSGGLINNAAAAFAFADQFENALPIWGIQKMNELEEFLGFFENPPSMNDGIAALIEADRKELSGEFCRGCGYCMPCTVGIRINDMARMSLMLRRAPSARFLDEANQAEMAKIKDCVNCGQCKEKCPYGLDTPALLARNLEDYEKVLAGETLVTG